MPHRGKIDRPVLYCTRRHMARVHAPENNMIRTIQSALAGAIIAASCAAATAQTLRVRGTIEKADGNVLTLRSTDGAELKLTLTENALIVAVVKASMADIKEGTFLGSAAMPQPDGSQKALEVHIFPEQMRGTGEGHRPYAPVANSTMTNGSASGSTVVRYEVGGKGDLKACARFTVLAATKKPDGTLEASRINVGRDGVVPQ